MSKKGYATATQYLVNNAYVNLELVLNFLQNKTMQMMYETISKALVEAGLEAAFSVQDYLNFFCLGNREAINIYENISVLGNPPPANSPQVCH